jgi:hypothetical protein
LDRKYQNLERKTDGPTPSFLLNIDRCVSKGWGGVLPGQSEWSMVTGRNSVAMGMVSSRNILLSVEQQMVASPLCVSRSDIAIKISPQRRHVCVKKVNTILFSMGEINALHIPPFVMIGRVLTNFGKFSLYY